MLASFLAGPAAFAAPPPTPLVTAPKASASPQVPATAWTPPASAFAVAGGAPGAAWTPTITPPPGPTGSAPVPGTPGSPGVGPAPQFAPPGTKVGAPGLGLLPSSGVEGFALSAGTSASVNLANGNLVLRTTDTAINGAGVGLKLDRFYNSLSSGKGSFGRGSVLSTGRDVGLAVESNGVVTFSGPSGFTATFTPKVGGGYTPSAGINADLTRNKDNSYALVYRASGEKLTFDSNRFLVADVDRNGTGISLGYSSDGTLASIGRTGHQGATFTYGPNGITKAIDSAGRPTTYVYSAAGDLIKVKRSDQAYMYYDYDSAGRLTGIQVAGGEWTDFGYDSSSRITSVKRYLTNGQRSGDAATTTFSYAAGSNGATTTKETNPLGKATTYALDAQGRVTKTTDPLGRARATTWTPNGDVSTATDALGTAGTGGRVTTYAYDTNNQVTSVAIPTGAKTRLQYAGGAGCSSTDTTHPYLAKCSTDAQGNITSTTYDAAGNVVKTQNTSANAANGGVATTLTRQGGSTDCNATPGQVCFSTNGNGALTTYRYEANSTGNVAKIIPPAPLKPTFYGYDSLNRLVAAVDGNGKVTKYSYDIRDHVVAITYNTALDSTPATATTTAYTYNADGAVTQQDDPGTSTAYGYDGIGREFYTARTGWNVPTTVSYDDAGNVTNSTDVLGLVTYSYNAANELITVAQPRSTCPASGVAAGCTRFGYDANGRRTTIAYPGGVVQTTTYDAAGRATRIVAGKAGAPAISDLSYSYTAPGSTGTSGDRALLQSKTTTVSIAGAPNGAVTTYGYDSLSRLTTATEKTSSGAASAAWGYSYDAAGNRTGATTTTPGKSATTTTAYNAADEITTINGSSSGIAYDAQGNEISAPTSGVTPTVPTPTPGRTTAYTPANQAATFTPTGGSATAQTYLGADNNIRTTSGTTKFRNGELGLTSQAPDSGFTQATTFTRTPDGTLVGEGGTVEPQYYLFDNLGSVIGLVNSTGAKTAGYAYDPYGATRAVTGNAAIANANPFRFTAGYLDSATGLYKFGYRYYDANQGRFTQPDPSGQERNAYTYVTNNAINRTDVTGTISTLGWIGIGVGVVGLAASGAGLPIALGVVEASYGLGAGLTIGGFFATVAGTTIGIGACVVNGC